MTPEQQALRDRYPAYTRPLQPDKLSKILVLEHEYSKLRDIAILQCPISRELELALDSLKQFLNYAKDAVNLNVVSNPEE